MSRRVGRVLFAALVLTGCGTPAAVDPLVPPAAPTVLTAPAPTGTWTAGADASATDDATERRFFGTPQPGAPLAAGEVLEVRLGADRLTADIGCNQLVVDYSLVDGRLVSGTVLTTAMACEDEAMSQDDWLHSLLTSSPTFELDGLTLRLGDFELLEDTAPNPADAPLLGSVWHITNLVGPNGGSWGDWRRGTVVFVTTGAMLEVVCLRTWIDLTVDVEQRTIAPAAPAVSPPTVAPLLRQQTPTTTMPPTSLPVGPPPTPIPTSTLPGTSGLPTNSTTTSPMPVPTITLPPVTTAPPPCDASAPPSEWEIGVVSVFEEPLTYEIDIDELHLRSSDGSGLDLVVDR